MIGRTKAERWGMGLTAAFMATYGPISVWGFPHLGATAWMTVGSALLTAGGTAAGAAFKLRADRAAVWREELHRDAEIARALVQTRTF